MQRREMKIAGRKLTGTTTFAMVAAGFAAALAGIDYLRDGASNAYVDRVATAEHLEPKNDMKAAYEGRLVWVSGTPTGSNSVRDIDFNIELPVLRLERHSEIFQWQEDSRKHRRYSVHWFAHGIDSRDFRQEEGHENTGSITYPDFSAEPSSYQIGPARLDRSYVDQMQVVKVPVTKEIYASLPDKIRAAYALSSEGTLVPGDDGHVRELKIGDNRTRFDGVYANPVTVVGQYSNGTVIPVDVGGELVHVLRNESTTLEKIVSDMRASTHSWTVILGVLSAALLGLGLALFGLDFANAEEELPPARFGR
jgi:hypothetical protein